MGSSNIHDQGILRVCTMRWDEMRICSLCPDKLGCTFGMNMMLTRAAP